MNVKKLLQFQLVYVSTLLSLIIFSLGFLLYESLATQKEKMTESLLRRDIIKHYYAMAPYDTDQESPYGAVVRRMVADGELTWEELGFTEDDLEKIERKARVSAAKRQYDAMLHDAEIAPFYTMSIRQKVAEGQLTWEELGFTEDDLKQRNEEARRVLNVEKKYSFST
jgi:hypothetical protein